MFKLTSPKKHRMAATGLVMLCALREPPPAHDGITALLPATPDYWTGISGIEIACLAASDVTADPHWLACKWGHLFFNLLRTVQRRRCRRTAPCCASTAVGNDCSHAWEGEMRTLDNLRWLICVSSLLAGHRCAPTAHAQIDGVNDQCDCKEDTDQCDGMFGWIDKGCHVSATGYQRLPQGSLRQ